MKKAQKLALLAITGVLSTTLLIGGATYAIFKSNVTNSNNKFTAGTLQISAKRDDVPNHGPMFYTQSTPGNVGGLPTGLWAPGDKNTRGLFLENKGSLEAKLMTLTAKTADGTGNEVSTGAQFADDMLFANQSRVKIWQVQEFDALGGMIPFVDTRLNATEMDAVMDGINAGYNFWLALHPGADLNDQATMAAVMAAVNNYLFEHLSELNSSLNNRFFKVVKVYDQPMNNLVNTPFSTSSLNIKVAPEQAILLAFTVELSKTPPAGIDKNALQGKQVYFNFGTNWEQTRNQ